MELTLGKGYNPIKQTVLIKPIRLQDVPRPMMRDLYIEEDLTEYEILILEFIGILNVIKGGLSLLSFQGLKRLLNIHQAKLTKALNRLIEKEFLEKVKSAYRLSDDGSLVFNRIYKELDLHEDRIPEKLFSHVVKGRIIGYIDPFVHIRKSIANGLMGKWFGSFRFIAKVDYESHSEVCWMSTDGITSISFLMGPENEITIVHSSSQYSDAETELQILVDRISQTIEDEMGLIVEIATLVVYENDEIMT